MEQLQLFSNDNIMELAEGSSLSIWYKNTSTDGDADLICSVVEVEDDAIQFWVDNGHWEGMFYPNKMLVQNGLDDDISFSHIDRFEFYDKNYFKVLNKLKGIEEIKDSWDDDIPF